MNIINRFFCNFKNLFNNIVCYDDINRNFVFLEEFINESSIITKCDSLGRITFINRKFEEISGWKLYEVIGKNHNIFGDGLTPKSFWEDMFRTTKDEKKIWNGIIKNINKFGKPYYLDTYIKAEFDKDNNLIGYISVRQDITDIINTRLELEKKNKYLEYAAKIIRHDLHSGINVYIPIGVKSLERRIKEMESLEFPLKLIKGGLKQSQNVYQSVYEFTNLVKNGSSLNKKKCNVKEILDNFFTNTIYKKNIVLSDSLPELLVNESLFCTAVDNLVRNGLKYNDNTNKKVKIYLEGEDQIIIEDNGRGLSKEDFLTYSQPYVRKQNQKEVGSGLGLNISLFILEEHGFTVDCEKIKNGTKIKIKIK